MLNKPKFMSPSINMYGNTVIDLNSETLPFSCIVDGNEAVVAWQIKISTLKDNDEVFDSGKVIRTPAFYPINNRNQNVKFNIDLKEHMAKATDKFKNNKEPYYWSITLIGSTGTKVESAEEVFYANTTPSTAIYYSYDNNFLNDSGELDDTLKIAEDNTSVLTKRKIFLKAKYEQIEGVPLKRYGWRLTDTSNGVVIKDTITQNQIYGVEDDITCECNGLINNTKYLAELYIETQNGFGISKSVEFLVDYTVKNVNADFKAMPINETSGIMLNWGDLKTTEGKVEGGTVEYIDNFPIVSFDDDNKPNGSVSAEIPKNTSIVFDETNNQNLEIDENSYVVLSFNFDKTKDTVLFKMSGEDSLLNDLERELSYEADSRTLKYMVRKGDIVAYSEKSLSESQSEICWYVATLYPLFTDGEARTELKLSESVAVNGLYPSDSTYPSDETFPDFGEWEKLEEGDSSGV